MGGMFWASTGETVTLSTTFTVNGVATDPTAVALTVTDPTGTSTNYVWPGPPATVTRASAGSFWREVTLTAVPGVWSYVWTGTGTVADVDAGTFDVFAATELARLYATPAQLKSRVGIPDTDTSSDLELLGACRAATRMVDNYCHRVFWRGPAGEVRTVQLTDRGGHGYGYRRHTAGVVLSFGPYNDVVTLSGLAVDLDGDGVFETTWAPTDYALLPAGTLLGPEPQPYTGIESLGTQWLPYTAYWGRRDRAQLTGTFGWPQFPASVTEAARTLGAEVFRTKDAPLGLASFGEAGIARVRRNPIVAEMLDPYVHPDMVGVLA